MTRQHPFLLGAVTLLWVATASLNGQERERPAERERRTELQEGASEVSLSLPVRELISIRARVPQQVRVGDAFKYQVQVVNQSQDVMLHDVKVTQVLPEGFRIESSEVVSSARSQSTTSESTRNAQSASASRDERASQDEAAEKQAAQEEQQRQQQQQQAEAQEEQSGQPQGQAHTQDGDEASWTINQIGPGQQKTIVVTAAGDQEGAANLCLAISSYTPSLCIRTEFVKPELELVKQVPERAGLCEEIEFEYYVKNAGSGTISEFEIRDPLGDGLRTVSGEESLRFRVDGGLEAGETRKFVAHLRADQAGEYTSRAVAVLPDGEETRSAQPTTVVEAPELEVAIEGPGAQYVNRLMDYTVRVTNRGNVAARNARLVIHYPDEVRLARVNQRQGAQATVRAQSADDDRQPTLARRQESERQEERSERTAQQQAERRQSQEQQAASRTERQAAQRQQSSGESQAATEPIELGTIEPGQTVAVRFATVAESAGSVNYRAVAAFECATGDDEQRVTAEATTATDLIALPALAIGVTDDKDPVAVGDEVVYTVAVRNEGEAPDQNIRVTAGLAEGLEFARATGATEGKHEGQTITFEPVPELNPGEQVEWQIRAKVTRAQEAHLQATLTSDNRKREATAQEPTRLFDASQPDAATNQPDPESSKDDDSNDDASNDDESNDDESKDDESKDNAQ